MVITIDEDFEGFKRDLCPACVRNELEGKTDEKEYCKEKILV